MIAKEAEIALGCLLLLFPFVQVFQVLDLTAFVDLSH